MVCALEGDNRQKVDGSPSEKEIISNPEYTDDVDFACVAEHSANNERAESTDQAGTCDKTDSGPA